MKVPAENLRELLGITHVNYVAGNHTLAVVDSNLAMTSAAEANGEKRSHVEVKIDNFSFGPKVLTVSAGSTVKWTNHDDIPHNIVSVENKFSSPTLDTDQSFAFQFREPGRYPYFCKIHPMMTGTVVVERQA